MVRGIDPKALDVLLSDELAKLSPHDRNVLQEQLHGISTGVPTAEAETPELLEGALNLMAYEIDFFIKDKDKQSYLEAITDYPDTTYVKDNDFRLRFLRCDQYDVKKAAERMVKFVDLVHTVFGPELLERPIQLKDVTTNPEEIELLRSSMFSLLPSKDRAGRRIFASVGNLGLRYSMPTKIKMTIYLFWTATEDIESQMKGLVVVMWPGNDVSSISVDESPNLNTFDIEKDKKKVETYYGDKDDTTSSNTNAVSPEDTHGDEGSVEGSVASHFNASRAKLHLAAARIFAAVPVRVVGHHCCGFPDTPLFQLVKAFVVLSLGKNRNTLRFHSGSATEMRYKLMSFGIPGDLVPMTDTGNVKNKNQLQWISIRRALESPQEVMSSSTSLPVEVPLCDDLLFRFGQPYTSHRGNIRFRELIAANYSRHRRANNEEKAIITLEVVDEIERRGRFLTWDRQNSWWIEMDDRETKRSKAATAFKEHGRRSRQQENIQSNDSCSKSLGPAWKKQKYGNDKCGCLG